MPRMFTFTNGRYRYAVNADRVAFVCTDAAEGRTRIYFSGLEDDRIEVDQDFEDVHNRLSS